MVADDSPPTAIRVRHRLAEHLWIAVLVCLLVAGASGFVAYAEFSQPDTRTEQQTVAMWTTDSEFTHQATVQRSTTAFEAGTVLRNRSQYLTGIAPELSATHVYRHEGDADPANVSTNVTLVKQSVDTTGSGQTEYWRVSETLEESTRTVPPGETVRTTFEMNVTAQRQQARRIDGELGGTPGERQVFFLVTTQVETTVDGETVRDSRTDRLNVQPRGSTYAVSAETAGEQTREITAPVSVPVESNPLRSVLGSLLAVAFLGAAAALVWADRGDSLGLPEETVAAIRLAATREEFDEWISVGTVPASTDDERLVAIDSLEDLVDVAIDSNRRVVEDRDSGQFVVVDDGTRYVFEPDRVTSNTATDLPAGLRPATPGDVDGDGANERLFENDGRVDDLSDSADE